MILTLWLALLVVSGFLIFLGYYSDDEPYLPVGLFFFFLLALVILNGNLQYQTGITKTTNFTYTNSSLTSQQEVGQDTYTTWNDSTSHQFGWTFAILSALAFGLSLFNLRKGRGDEYIQ